MELPELIHRIDTFQQRIEAAGPLSPEVKRRLEDKFRLEWNYHSNAMEGGSLTREETRSIMLRVMNIANKPEKDVVEMRGHDEVITNLLRMAKGELNLSEARIKEIQKTIIHEDEPERKAQLGNWKQNPNHVINYRGERFDFVAPDEVAEAMHRLLDRTKADIERIERAEKDAPHPALLAFQFHREFVTIHPFHDGNGRTARIFCNLLLMRFGYPPIVIRVLHKNQYNQLLADVQGYGAPPDAFSAFLAERLLHSLTLVEDAITGRAIEEEDDLDKRLALLDKKLLAVDPNERLERVLSEETLGWMLETWIIPMFERAIPMAQKFNTYFVNTTHQIVIMNVGNYRFQNESAAEIIQGVREIWKKDGKRTGGSEMSVYLHLAFGSFKHFGTRAFGCNYDIKVKLDYHSYSVFVDGFEREVRDQQFVERRLLHQPFTIAEQKEVVRRLGAAIMQHMEYWVDQNGNPPTEPVTVD